MIEDIDLKAERRRIRAYEKRSLFHNGEIPDHKIKFVQQPGDFGCGIACVAMVTDRGYEEAEYLVLNKEAGMFDEQVEMLLGRLKYYGETGKVSQAPPGGLYMLVVPSLNIKGGSHYIVLDYRDEDAPKIYDPNKGREGKEFYCEQTNPVKAFFATIEIFKRPEFV